MFLRVRPVRAAAPSPDTPPPEQKSLQAEATTCSEPRANVDCPGFFFVAGQAN